ncbi:hypothetical protein KFL_003050020 [Klebsormidium nitens]|uniref:Uncharacterized protein n=1 Tax=Klebsormidium nitens TaxID=105231 RepID=A0A1Y1I6W8_KLENI|nr:hypothetical protein KFL_003050020 [Klebsormidium nitens]|eukprot:GAQ86690.1 hypothetical protein KFL_003050020 [Klebsormidium nitens]
METRLQAKAREAFERYACWDSVLDEHEREFRARMTSDDVFDAPVKTGIRTDRANFCEWYFSGDRDLVLWFVDGEAWIAGVRSFPLRKLAYGAFEHLRESIDKLAFLKPAPLNELDGRVQMGESYLEATTGVYHQNWESRKGGNLPIVIHAFDTWASLTFMKTALDWFMQAPGVYLCVGLKPSSAESTSPCIAIARWKDPNVAEGMKETYCDGSVEALRVPLKACFEGEEHVPPLLQAHSEKDVTIDLSCLALRYRKWCAMCAM